MKRYLMNDIITFEQATKSYLQYIKNALSNNTYLAYSRGINRFSRFLLDQGFDTQKPITEFEIDPFSEFIKDLERYTHKPGTLSIIIASLSGFRRWLIENDYIKIDQFVEKSYKLLTASVLRNSQNLRGKLIDFSFSPNNILATAQLSILDNLEDYRNVAVIYLLLFSDFKPHEITKIRVKDLDLLNQSAVIQLSTTKTRRISFNQQATDAIRQYWNKRGWQNEDDPAFARHDRGVGKRHQTLTSRSIQNIVQTMCQRAGFEKNITSTDLRVNHYLAILEYAIDINIAEKCMAFNSFETTRIYKKPIN
jgi:site-specific recombinase XerD